MIKPGTRVRLSGIVAGVATMRINIEPVMESWNGKIVTVREPSSNDAGCYIKENTENHDNERPGWIFPYSCMTPCPKKIVESADINIMEILA